MHLAAEKGKRLRLRRFLSGDVNARDNKGYTPLFLAAYNGHLHCVTMLLDAKADIDAIVSGATALMVASRDGNLDVVNALIEARADVNMQNTAGTALSVACGRTNNHNIIAALLAAGALIENPGDQLAAVLQSNSIESMKLLIAAGADVNADLSGDGRVLHVSPLSIATVSGNITAAKLLLDAKADMKSVRGYESSLLIAVCNGNVEMTKFYVSAGVDVNMRSPHDCTCLHSLAYQRLLNGKWTREKFDFDADPLLADRINAIPCDYPGVLKVLVDAKADVSARSFQGQTPLFVAAQRGNVKAVKALLAVGANVNDAIYNGATPLLAASASGNLPIVKALLAAGADVNHVANGGTTAILAAVCGMHIPTVSTLIAAGANLNGTCTRAKVTVMDVAIADTGTQSDLCSILREAGAKTKLELLLETSELVRAASCHDVDLVIQLAENASKEEKDMALAVAVVENMLLMTYYLLAAGATSSEMYGGQSIMILASIRGYTDIVRVLLEAGVDTSQKDRNGMTALIYAMFLNHHEVVVLLRAVKGVDREKYWCRMRMLGVVCILVCIVSMLLQRASIW
jgi:ankyrin repeat protein